MSNTAKESFEQASNNNLTTSPNNILPTESLPNPNTNLFAVPATLSRAPSSQNSQDYVFTFTYKEKEEIAKLKPNFLTALEKDGLKIKWDEARPHLQLGCQSKIDVTQSKPASFNGNWLVFGLYIGELSTQSGHRDSSPFTQRRHSKEFDWMKDMKKVKDVNIDLTSLCEIENQLVDIEDSVFVYSSELDSAERALVEVRENLDDCRMESEEESSQDGSHTDGQNSSLVNMNETFTLEESIIPNLPASGCIHMYEVGVVVISVTSDCLQLVGPLGDIWVRTEVRNMDTPVYDKGRKVSDFSQVRVGDMASIVTRLCIKCQVDKTVECLAPPLLVWFGEEQKPGVRSQPGVVVWIEDDKFLVKLDGSGLVMFTGSDKKYNNPVKGWKVLVWAWRKVGNCAEGAAWILQDQDSFVDLRGKEVKPSLAVDDLDLLALETLSPITVSRSPTATLNLDCNENIGRVAKPDSVTISDKCSDVSFGSISECEEIDPNKSFNSNLSQVIDSYSTTVGNVTSQKDQFQVLYSGKRFSFQDGVDIDLKFEQVMATNGLMDNYDGLAKKYDDYFHGSKTPVSTGKPSVAPICLTDLDIDSASRSPPSCSISSESCPQDFLQTPPLLRRMPCPSLSPIPEETAESYPETPVFSISVDKFSEDSGYFDSFYAGSSNTKPVRRLTCSSDKTFTSSEDLLTKQLQDKLVLEQFLEFTKFPVSSRKDIIDLFISSFMKEVA